MVSDNLTQPTEFSCSLILLTKLKSPMSSHLHARKIISNKSISWEQIVQGIKSISIRVIGRYMIQLAVLNENQNISDNRLAIDSRR